MVVVVFYFLVPPHFFFFLKNSYLGVVVTVDFFSECYFEVYAGILCFFFQMPCRGEVKSRKNHQKSS